MRIAMRLALPKRTFAGLGKECISAHALIWLARRLKELSDIFVQDWQWEAHHNGCIGAVDGTDVMASLHT